MEWSLLAAVLLVAFCNGANDNFKGFATVWGAAALNYRQALALATLATAAGSITSLILAEALLEKFSGKGLVSDVITGDPAFLPSVALGAAATVFLATRRGLPISTTHALIGGLAGAGMAHPAGEVYFGNLASVLLLPLLISPLSAVILGVSANRFLRWLPVDKDCACIVMPAMALASAAAGPPISVIPAPSLVLAPAAECERMAIPARFSVPRCVNRLHILSALTICFARAVNDTPKLAALLIALPALNSGVAMAAVAFMMALGGILFARRVAETMSHRVTRVDHSHGLAANLITAGLVLSASGMGLPVSTTHVSVGAIAGAGEQTLNRAAVRDILLSWAATMPLAALLAWGAVGIIGLARS